MSLNRSFKCSAPQLLKPEQKVVYCVSTGCIPNRQVELDTELVDYVYLLYVEVLNKVCLTEFHCSASLRTTGATLIQLYNIMILWCIHIDKCESIAPVWNTCQLCSYLLGRRCRGGSGDAAGRIVFLSENILIPFRSFCFCF